MRKKLIVLSMDAMVHEDVAYLSGKPNFSKLMSDRAEVERVRTIYPSITYPAHVSISTGCLPGKHGVISNTEFKTVRDGIDHWHLYAHSLQVEDIFCAAKRAGCSTAAVYWPVTGLNQSIDYLIDEYFFRTLARPRRTALRSSVQTRPRWRSFGKISTVFHITSIKSSL